MITVGVLVFVAYLALIKLILALCAINKQEDTDA